MKRSPANDPGFDTVHYRGLTKNRMRLATNEVTPRDARLAVPKFADIERNSEELIATTSLQEQRTRTWKKLSRTKQQNYKKTSSLKYAEPALKLSITRGRRELPGARDGGSLSKRDL